MQACLVESIVPRLSVGLEVSQLPTSAWIGRWETARFALGGADLVAATILLGSDIEKTEHARLEYLNTSVRWARISAPCPLPVI
jgi:hypothetical protein